MILLSFCPSQLWISGIPLQFPFNSGMIANQQSTLIP